MLSDFPDALLQNWLLQKNFKVTGYTHMNIVYLNCIFVQQSSLRSLDNGMNSSYVGLMLAFCGG